MKVSLSNASKKKVSGENDFYWSEKMEPHAPRKKELLKKYGKEINQLMGPEPWTKYKAVAVVAFHITVGVYAINQPSWWVYFALAFIIGGTCAHNLFLAIHEITHYTAFKTKVYNDYLAMFTNIAMVIPYAMHFKQYHYEHHRYQGWDGIDLDIPSEIEAVLLSSFPGKVFFITFQIFFYALRPMFQKPIPYNFSRVLNLAVVVTGDALMYKFFGPNILIYLLLSMLFGTGLTPFAGHFISEHYLLGLKIPEAQETHSYYGWANLFTWNVGYHNEHHDFPNIPWTRLAKLKETAPEFYDHLNATPSWFGAQLQFLFDSRTSQWSRMKREKGAGERKGELIPTTKDAKSSGALFSA